MTSVLASIRPDSWNFPLFLHIAGATIFFGAITVAAVTQLASARAPRPEFLQRVAFRTLLIVGLPAYVIFRIGAQWIYDKEFGDASEDPTWIGIGFIVSDIGAILFLIALILAGLAVRKRNEWLVKSSGVLTAIILVALVVAVWAMGAKPD
jgi:hypothetical protein